MGRGHVGRAARPRGPLALVGGPDPAVPSPRRRAWGEAGAQKPSGRSTEQTLDGDRSRPGWVDKAEGRAASAPAIGVE